MSSPLSEQARAIRELRAGLSHAALERPVGPVAPLRGDHIEALAERARIVAYIRAATLGLAVVTATGISCLVENIQRGAHAKEGT
jgi:hypothetical protein